MNAKSLNPIGRDETPTVDFIVVGAGPAGRAVAARLAQSSPEARVALIEAGPAKTSLFSNVPLGMAASWCRSARGAITPMRPFPNPASAAARAYRPRGRDRAARASSTP